MRSVGVVLTFVLSACGGAPASKPVAAPPPAAAEPLGLQQARRAFAEVDRVPDPEPFAILEDQVRAGRDGWPAAARAEGDLLLVLASARMIEERLDAVLDPEAGAHEELAATALPIAFDERRLDGELAPAYRDRLCQSKASGQCENVLPDYWGARLAYVATTRLDARAGEILPGCGACSGRYQAGLERLHKLPYAALDHDSAAKDSWVLDQDVLTRSALALTTLPPTDVLVHVRLADDGAITIGEDEIAARLKPLDRRAAIAGALTRARERLTLGDGQRLLIEVDARVGTPTRDLSVLGRGALDSGHYAGLALVTRSAAPPYFRGWLVVEIVEKTPGKKQLAKNPGWRTVTVGKKDTMQTFVDRLDERLGSLGDSGGRLLLALDGKG